MSAGSFLQLDSCCSVLQGVGISRIVKTWGTHTPQNLPLQACNYLFCIYRQFLPIHIHLIANGITLMYLAIVAWIQLLLPVFMYLLIVLTYTASIRPSPGNSIIPNYKASVSHPSTQVHKSALWYVHVHSIPQWSFTWPSHHELVKDQASPIPYIMSLLS